MGLPVSAPQARDVVVILAAVELRDIDDAVGLSSSATASTGSLTNTPTGQNAGGEQRFEVFRLLGGHIALALFGKDEADVGRASAC